MGLANPIEPIPGASYLATMRSGRLLTAAILAACTPAAPRSPSPAPAGSAGRSALPPVPLVTGALAPSVVYPPRDHLIESRDSNFIFGSLGNGRATLTIDGVRVPVLPNGSWIAWLPNPPATHPSYDLVAALGSDTVRVSQPVRLLPAEPVLADTGRLVIDAGSVTPSGTWQLRDDDPVYVSVRAPANARVMWVGDSGLSARLVGGTPVPGGYAADPDLWATEMPARVLRARTELVVTRGADSVRVALPAVAQSPATPAFGMLGPGPSTESDTDRVIIARPVPGGTYKWLLMPGTVLPITGSSGDFVRVRLDAGLEAWVRSSDIAPLPLGWAPRPRVAQNATLQPVAGAVDLRIPMASRPAFLVDEGERRITLTLYGVRIDTDILRYAANDSLVRNITWQQVTDDRARFTLRLARDPYGYQVFWDGGALVLRVRRPPIVNPARPLAGLVIAVDPGHPPVGATGPTGLYEADAVLAVGLKLRDLLDARGATVVMTRTTAGPVPLGDRPIVARRADANALVSIHLNALPDGVNPFVANGTGAYFFQPQSEPLARALQNGMVRRMGLRNLGVYYDNLALARPTWMPAVLCEGAFIMMPDQEAALRTSAFQAAYARGIADGLEAYFRSMASGR